MKIFGSMLVGLGLSIALATAASAQSYTPELGSGNVAPPLYAHPEPYGAVYNSLAGVNATGHRLLMKQTTRPKL